MSLARDITTVGSATLLSRLLGFGRDMGIAALLGAGVFSDAFFAVLQIVNFFRRLLAEGALNAAFVPMWLRIKQAEGESGAFRFFYDVFRIMALAVVALALIGMLFAGAVIVLLAPGFDGERHALAADYLQVAAPYVALAGAVAVIAAALNAEGRVTAVAIGTVAFNIILLLVLAWLSVIAPLQRSFAAAVLAHAIVFAGLTQLVVTGVGFVRLKPMPARGRIGASSEARRFFALAVPGLVSAGIPQLKLIAGAMVASSSPAAVSWLYYANRLYELPLGVASIATAAVLAPAIAAAVRDGEREGIAGRQSRSFEIALGLALPAAVAFAVLADPIARALFERGAFGAGDAAAVAAALAAICVGLPGHALEKVLGGVSFAHEDTRTPMLAALAGLAAAVAGSLALFPSHGHVGVAAAIGMSGWVGATLLGITLWRRRWLHLDRAAARRLPRIVAATLAMGLAVFGAHALLAPAFGAGGSQLLRLIVLALLVAIGLVVYVASIELFGVARLRDLLGALRGPGKY
jgi:putative peptidoglycan lipid II flippase